MYICDLYESELKYYCQRYSNNSKPVFTDQEIITIYLFAGYCQKYFLIKDIHLFASEYLSSWFPLLPSYQTFNLRVNRLSEAFKVLSEKLINTFIPQECLLDISQVDSYPIMTCTGRNRVGKVAPQITSKGFCSTKNQYYYGMKLHALTFRQEGKIPFPESLILTPAQDNDLTVFKQAWGDTISNRKIFADKIYSNFEYFSQEKKQTQQIEMYTPVKAIKGMSQQEKQQNKAYDDLFSHAVSKVRQPIESFFNWLNEKTNIQRAHKTRSTSGLLVHTMGKIAIAFIYLIF
ncbi:IS4/IS5 family transposase [Parabacteroides sp. 52]|nr:IS4/IS5 family transposase [Parabacteroides sp. 52]